MKPHLRIHYFQHMAGEGFGSCYDFLKQHQAKLTATEFFALPTEITLEIDALPQVDEVDLLIIMSGTMSVNDEVNYPWLKIEKRWLRRYLATGRPVIGLNLGGQLIASALGALVGLNQQEELGWSTVYRVDNLPESCFKLPDQFDVVQWHRESFDIPKGAVCLAQNQVCRNQIYQIGNNVLGFQFQPEMTPEVLQIFLDNDEELALFGAENIHRIENMKTSTLQEFMQGNDILNRAIQYVLGSELL